MGKKQKKKATKKEISQKTCAAENGKDKTGIDNCSDDSLSCACNDEDSESKVVDLEKALKIKVEELQNSKVTQMKWNQTEFQIFLVQ